MNYRGVDSTLLQIAGLQVEKDNRGRAISFNFVECRQNTTADLKGKSSPIQNVSNSLHDEKSVVNEVYSTPKRQRVNQNRIQWGKVDSFYFSDAIGYGVVPSRGFYPLGMGAEEEKHRSSLSVDEAQQRQQEMLLQRAQICGVCTDASKANGATEKSISESVHVFETRQYDYKKKGATNPLFTPLSEEERLLRLLPKVEEEFGGSGHHAASSSSTASPGRKSKRRSGSLTDFNREVKLEEKEELGFCDEKRTRSASLDLDSRLGLETDMSVAALNKELRAIRTYPTLFHLY